jgi:hypothetical protein
VVIVVATVALKIPSKNGGTPHMLPCVLPLSLRRTSLDTSELKTVKLFHLSGRPRSWTLYDFLNFAYLLLSHSKNLIYGNFHVDEGNLSRALPAQSRLLPTLFDY